MQFKKGSFGTDTAIYPVAIKYDARFTDAFWNSSQEGPMKYIFMLMTSWALVCDVWYLPPMTRGGAESAADFADRVSCSPHLIDACFLELNYIYIFFFLGGGIQVKAAIADKCGVVALQWDGQLKRSKPKKELKERQQLEYCKQLFDGLEAFRPESRGSDGTRIWIGRF